MSGNVFDDPNHWRGRAEEVRLVAHDMADGQSKQLMFDIAAGYERLARRAQRRSSGTQSE
jgi:hypothetical protein